MSYYIGVDGGGTKTAYALFDENKNMLHLVKTGGTNHENLPGSFAQAAQILMEGINRLLDEKGIGLDEIEGILMGLAGIDHRFQHDAMAKLLSEKGLRSFRIYNDGFIVTKAGSPDGKGIGYNCGTGTCCNSIDSHGNMLQVGGFGVLSGDTGNGYWIGEETFAAIYRDICLKAHETVMSDIFCQKAGIEKTPDAFLECVPKFEESQREEYCVMLTDSFFEAANKGDREALAITERMADAGSDLICAHLKMQHFDEGTVNVVLSGSMNVKMPNDIYLTKLREKCAAKSGRSLSFTKLTVPPVVGCINWLLEDKK